MIARFTTLLPFVMTVKQDGCLKAYPFSYGEYRVTVFPPLQSRISYEEAATFPSVSLGEIASRLEPESSQGATTKMSINDVPTIQADLLQIDFSKDEFDRRHLPFEASMPHHLEVGDPKPQLAFGIANELIAKLRTISRGPMLRPLDA